MISRTIRRELPAHRDYGFRHNGRELFSDDDLLTYGLMDDSDLVDTIRGGELMGLAEVYERHGGAVYRHAQLICGNSAAEQVTCDVFLALWRKPDPAPEPEVSILRRLLTDAHRRANAARRCDTQLRSLDRRSVASHLSTRRHQP